VEPLADGDPTPVEQELLELMNRARRDPLGEADRLGIDLNEGLPEGTLSGEPVAPLAMNLELLKAGRAHAQDMLDRNFFAHNAPDGSTPFERIRSAGYRFQAAGENLSFSGNTRRITPEGAVASMYRGLFVDEGIPGRGHRTNILSPQFREAGVAFRTGRFTQNGITFNAVMNATSFGARYGQRLFVMGVVYDDRNKDGRYTAGEGLPGVKINLSGATWGTRAAGAFTFAVSRGTHELWARSDKLGISANTTFKIGSESIKIDLVKDSGLVVR
jgi:hypothetical protein